MIKPDVQCLKSPLAFIEHLIDSDTAAILEEYESWWLAEGMPVSEAVDRGGTPHLRIFDQFGRRTDEILFPPDYWTMLKKGYETGVIWRPFESDSLKMHYLIDYVTCFFDAGLGCPYIVSLSTALPIKKYGSAEMQKGFLPHLLRRDGTNWQGATWMTEAKGGSDLGANVETVARFHGEAVTYSSRGQVRSTPPPEPNRLMIQEPASAGERAVGNRWLLTGDKYFASNVGAELAIVAARPQGAPPSVQGLALFLVPRYRGIGPTVRKGSELNYFIRRLKPKIGTRSVPTGEVELRDSEAFLLGKPEWGHLSDS
jgi:acyl-CoA dehydrogenase